MKQDPRNNFFKIIIAERLVSMVQNRAQQILDSIKLNGTDSDLITKHLQQLSEILSVQCHLTNCLAKFETDDYHDFEFCVSIYEGMIFGYHRN